MPDYWYYYFETKRQRNDFVEDVESDGHRVIHVANEVYMRNGKCGFLAIVSTNVDCRRNVLFVEVNGSPWDY